MGAKATNGSMQRVHGDMVGKYREKPELTAQRHTEHIGNIKSTYQQTRLGLTERVHEQEDTRSGAQHPQRGRAKVMHYSGLFILGLGEALAVGG